MTSNEDAVKQMNRANIADGLIKGYVKDIDVPVLLIEADPSKGESFPGGEYPYIYTKKDDGKYGIIVPEYQKEFWEKRMGEATGVVGKTYQFTMRKVTARFRLTDVEAYVIESTNMHLHEVIVNLKHRVVYLNPRTKREEIIRKGIKDAVTILPDEVVEPENHQCEATTNSGERCKMNGTVLVDGKYYCANHARKAQSEE